MPTPTYVALQTFALSTSSTSVIFASIPDTYRDLVIIIEGAPGGNNPLDMEFNGDTTNSNYACVVSYNSGSTTTSFTENTSYAGTNWYTANNRTLAKIQIFDYTQTNKQKVSLIRSGGVDWIAMTTTRWNNTSAITSINLDLRGGSFASGTSFSLYGIGG